MALNTFRCNYLIQLHSKGSSDWLGRLSPKRPIICQVGCWTLHTIPVCVYVRQLSGVSYESLRPVTDTLVSCLQSRLSVYCHVINTHLLHTLSRDHSLSRSFNIIHVSTAHLYYFLVQFSSVTFLCQRQPRIYIYSIIGVKSMYIFSLDVPPHNI